MLLYKTKGQIPKNEYTLPIGEAEVKREGRNITVVTYSLMVHRYLSAAEKLSEEGIDAEVIDLKTLSPFDLKTVVNSVKKTNKVVIVHQACLTGGLGAEIGMRMVEAAFDYLDSPIKRIGSLDVPVPFSPLLEDFVVPTEEKIAEEIKKMVGK